MARTAAARAGTQSDVNHRLQLVGEAGGSSRPRGRSPLGGCLDVQVASGWTAAFRGSQSNTEIRRTFADGIAPQLGERVGRQRQQQSRAYPESSSAVAGQNAEIPWEAEKTNHRNT